MPVDTRQSYDVLPNGLFYADNRKFANARPLPAFLSEEVCKEIITPLNYQDRCSLSLVCKRLLSVTQPEIFSTFVHRCGTANPRPSDQEKEAKYKYDQQKISVYGHDSVASCVHQAHIYSCLYMYDGIHTGPTCCNELLLKFKNLIILKATEVTINLNSINKSLEDLGRKLAFLELNCCRIVGTDNHSAFRAERIATGGYSVKGRMAMDWLNRFDFENMTESAAIHITMPSYENEEYEVDDYPRPDSHTNLRLIGEIPRLRFQLHMLRVQPIKYFIEDLNMVLPLCPNLRVLSLSNTFASRINFEDSTEQESIDSSHFGRGNRPILQDLCEYQGTVDSFNCGLFGFTDRIENLWISSTLSAVPTIQGRLGCPAEELFINLQNGFHSYPNLVAVRLTCPQTIKSGLLAVLGTCPHLEVLQMDSRETFRHSDVDGLDQLVNILMEISLPQGMKMLRFTLLENPYVHDNNYHSFTREDFGHQFVEWWSQNAPADTLIQVRNDQVVL